MSNLKIFSTFALASLLAACGGGSSCNQAFGSLVNCSAKDANVAPEANAGPTQSVLTGATVTLDGSASHDANNDTLTYKWVLSAVPANSAAVLTAATSAKPTFVADVSGTYLATLQVNDGKVDS
ncbi:MAG: PKD domain-containing protein, partial [Rhodoferax sp.]